MNGVNIAMGYGLASYMGMAFYYAPFGEAQWRGPLGIALIWPVIMLIVVSLPFVPESPRWLLLKGRHEKARDVVMDLHFVKGDADQEFARSELYQMQKQAEFDKTLNPSWVSTTPSIQKRERTTPTMSSLYLRHERLRLIVSVANVRETLLSQARFPCNGLCLHRSIHRCTCLEQLWPNNLQKSEFRH